jgi:hypothetical protein
MANTAQVRTGPSTLFQNHLDDKLINVNFKRMPFLALMGLKNGDKEGIFDLGRPKAETPQRGLLISGNASTMARKAEVLGSFVFQPIIQSGVRPNPTVTSSSALSNDPQVEDWASNQFFEDLARPEVRYVRYVTPFSISKDYMDFMRQKAGGNSTEGGWEAISGLQLAEITTRTAQHCKSIDDDIHTATGPTNASSTRDYWDAPFSVKLALDTTSTYLGIDRGVAGNEWWKGNTVTDATQLNVRAMVDYANYTSGGPRLADYGLGIDSLIMAGDLYGKALREAEARGSRVVTPDIPEIGKFGLKKYVAVVDERVWVIHDPTMPSGHVAGINWSTWTVAMHPSARFTVRGPYDQSENAGGARAMTGVIQTLLMGPFCDWPAGNIYWTSVS